jgi:hypothetical protein
MSTWLRAIVLCSGLLLVGPAPARPTLATLSDRLEGSSDFRIRVQAALELGKLRTPKAVRPLTSALDDPSSSVRAAAAAGLKILGDASALTSLRQHRSDKSEPVRAQIRSSIEALETRGAATREPPRVLIKLGAPRSTRTKTSSVEKQLLASSRTRLDSVPGIQVLPDDDEVARAAEKQDIPVLLVTTRIEKLLLERDGVDLVYAARVEYLVHRLPGEALAARVAGSASETASEEEATDRGKSAEIRRSVLDAAVRSAMRNAPRALFAAAAL